ncbi:hypothetical protein F4808DRAFT_459357 [Astrocystis sublimbata]|nr:hypothetical protein F4808DRAFT_459357 [Astrocystis sublimbata]
MGSVPFWNTDGNSGLPSTFSPFRNNDYSELVDRNDRDTAAAQTTWPSTGPMTSPHIDPSIAYGDPPDSFLRKQASSTVSLPHSLKPLPSISRRPLPSQFITKPPHTAMSSRYQSPVGSAENIGGLESPDTGRHLGTASTLSSEPSSASSSKQYGPPSPTVSTLKARKSAAFINPQHPRAESIPMSAMYSQDSSSTIRISEDNSETGSSPPRYAKSHLDCHSREDVYSKRRSRLFIVLVFLSIYSTSLSGLWFLVSIVQPQYGRGVSTGAGWKILPSTATLLTTLAAKTIELSFVTVFVTVLGQVLTRRAFSKLSAGISLAEMTMRNWVIQPGSLITYWDNIPAAATTFLGMLTLSAAICSLLYTTASDAMVSPKLARQGWVMRDLNARVKTSYANLPYIEKACKNPLRGYHDPFPYNGTLVYPDSCLAVLLSGQSYQSLVSFLGEWDDIHTSRNSTMHQLATRPIGKHNLFDNTTMESSWVETEHGNVAAKFKSHKRIINNVTLAMPHAGVYAAATDPMNGILQPNDLMGLGEYSIKASVVSPVVNVMCVNMNKHELAPLIYTTWPNARTDNTGIANQTIGLSDWQDSVPYNWYNYTVVDKIFKWQQGSGRPPPAFQLYPADWNMLTNISANFSDPLYILGKSGVVADYTLCELRSWMTSNCSTTFDVSGTLGGQMRAHCEDPDDPNSYWHINHNDSVPTGDWRNLAEAWSTSMDLNGGVQNNNASNARVLTRLILDKPALNPRLPSMAEAVAVLASSTLVAGTLDSNFKSYWDYSGPDISNTTTYEAFKAQVQTQQYTSTHTAQWQAIFYVILGLTFVLNVLCFLYLVIPPSSSSSSYSSSSSSSRKPTPSLFSRFPFTNPFKRRTHGPVKSSPSLVESDSENEYPASSRQHIGAGKQNGKAAKGLVTDYTEPQNLFALAINSPSSRALAGSCGRGPDPAEMAFPWHVGYVPGANHYFFEEGDGARNGIADMGAGAMASGADLLGVDGGGGGGGGDSDYGRYGKSYKRLSSRRPWL